MDTPTSTPTLTPSEVIDRVHAARSKEHQGAIEQLELAVHWALLHPCPSNEWPAHWGDPSIDETVTPLAGPGAPLEPGAPRCESEGGEGRHHRA